MVCSFKLLNQTHKLWLNRQPEAATTMLARPIPATIPIKADRSMPDQEMCLLMACHRRGPATLPDATALDCQTP